jgi:hypothetical protein
MTRYARDEFDKVPEASSRQGVHRTAAAPSKVRLWPILAVGVAALAIGLVSFLILPKLGFSGTDAQVAAASASQEAAPLADTAATQPAATGTAGAESPAAPSAAAGDAASGAEVPGAETDPEPGPAAATQAPVLLDKSQPVAVYNAAGTAGLAGRVGNTVQADGWTLGQVGNWAGSPQQGSTIFYAGPAQLANARALAQLLGVPTVVSSTEFQGPLVVVLGPGYR